MKLLPGKNSVLIILRRLFPRGGKRRREPRGGELILTVFQSKRLLSVLVYQRSRRQLTRPLVRPPLPKLFVSQSGPGLFTFRVEFPFRVPVENQFLPRWWVPRWVRLALFLSSKPVARRRLTSLTFLRPRVFVLPTTRRRSGRRFVVLRRLRLWRPVRRRGLRLEL